MLVWCMLVVGLIDEMKNQHAQVIVRYTLLTCFVFTNGTIMLISRGIQCLCFASNSRWYLTNHGAKDGIFGALRLVSRFKGPSLISQHHLVDIDSYISYLNIYASYYPNSQHICRGSNCYHMGFIKLVHILLHIVNMLEQATQIQMYFNSYLCERVVISYQKGEIESSSLVLVN